MTEAAARDAAVERYLSAAGDPEDSNTSSDTSRGQRATGRELDYKVELWDVSESYVERVLAITAHGSIGYAAYYAAIKEYPERYLTLCHKGGILSRSGGRRH
jgi:hypothetical protein